MSEMQEEAPPVPQVDAALTPSDRPTDDRYRWMVESVQDIIFEAAPTGAWTYLNPAWTRLLGYPVEESIGKGFLDYVHEEDRDGNLAIFLEVLQSGKAHCKFEARYVDVHGAYKHMAINAWIFRDADGTPLGSTGTLTDITARRLAEFELERRATHDPLTGLPNRSLLESRMLEMVERAQDTGVGDALMFLDLDRFKLVNDSLGHDAGDEVLRIIADRLRASSRPGDLVARFGGDEFVVVAEAIDPTSVRAVARRLHAAIREPLIVDNHELQLSASVGIRMLHPGEATGMPAEEISKALLRDADTAMYEAKETGRARTEHFEGALRERTIARLDLENALKRAAGRGELFLEYQPQVRLGSNKVTGMEALLRWNHPTRGRLGPNEFIPVAEDSAAIIDIGRWVLEEVCIRIRESIDAGNPLPRVSVNVSPTQFASGLVSDVAHALNVTEAPPELLCIEFTETGLLADTESTRASMSALADLGVDLSLDDFGTGYSSLSYLQTLPLTELKVDKSFVRRCDTPDGRAIVRAILAMADALNLTTVAEGVETREDAVRMESLGCLFGQGYLFGRPTAIEDARQLIEAIDSGSLSSDPLSP